MNTIEKLSLIAKKSVTNRGMKFSSLAHLVNKELLVGCFHELKRDKAVGVDGVTLDEYGAKLGDNISGLIGKMKSKTWSPKPVRRVYIPKPGKMEKRPLGIPTTEDKVIQMGVKKNY